MGPAYQLGENEPVYDVSLTRSEHGCLSTYLDRLRFIPAVFPVSGTRAVHTLLHLLLTVCRRICQWCCALVWCIAVIIRILCYIEKVSSACLTHILNTLLITFIFNP